MQKGEEFNRSEKDRKVRFWKRCVNVLTEAERFDFTILLVIHVFADFLNICRIIAPPAKAAGEARESCLLPTTVAVKRGLIFLSNSARAFCQT